MKRKSVKLVTGNSSWWKSRKYRRKTAKTLRELHQEGWRWVSKQKLPQRGIDTRRFTIYHFMKGDW